MLGARAVIRTAGGPIGAAFKHFAMLKDAIFVTLRLRTERATLRARRRSDVISEQH